MRGQGRGLGRTRSKPAIMRLEASSEKLELSGAYTASRSGGHFMVKRRVMVGCGLALFLVSGAPSSWSQDRAAVVPEMKVLLQNEHVRVQYHDVVFWMLRGQTFVPRREAKV